MHIICSMKSLKINKERQTDNMAKIVPQKASFETAEKLDRCHLSLTYITAGISFLAGLFPKIGFPAQLTTIVSDYLPGAILFLTCITILFRFLFEHAYHQAESIRRDTFFDNAFGCRIADTESDEYYNNDENPVGIKKAFLNIAENCFFSLDIISHMYKKRKTISILFAAGLLFVIIFNLGGNQLVLLAFNLIISINIAEDLSRLYSLKRSLEQVMLFVKSGIGTQQLDSPNAGKILREIVRYETALAYASTMLDSKYFKEINPQKTAEWEKIKKRYFSVEIVENPVQDESGTR